jgi:hypothetical protein
MLNAFGNSSVELLGVLLDPPTHAGVELELCARCLFRLR